MGTSYGTTRKPSSIKKTVSLKLKFEEFNHTVVFEGTHSFREILNLLKNTGYLEKIFHKSKFMYLHIQKKITLNI